MATQATELSDAPGPMAPGAVPRRAARGARRATRGRSSSSRSRASGSTSRPASSRCSTPSGRRGADLGLGRARRPARPHGARRRRRHAGDLRVAARRRARRARPVRERLAGRARRRAATSWSSPAASGSRRSGPRSTTCSAAAATYGEVALLYGSRTPGRPPLPQGARALARPVRPRGRRHRRRRRRAAGAGKVGVVPKLIARRAVRPRLDRRVRLRAGDHDALHRPRPARARRPAPSGSTSRWSATCAAALGHCGHCQLGPTLICRDGPVYRYDEIEPLMAVREL